MHDSDASEAGLSAFGQEAPCRLARLVAIHAVQVQVRLGDPTPPSQITNDSRWQAGAGPGGFVTTFEMEVKKDRAVQGFKQRRGFVTLTLAWQRGWRRGFVMHPIPVQRAGIPYGFLKQRPFVSCRHRGFRGRSISGIGIAGPSSCQDRPGSAPRRAPPCNQWRRT